MKIYKQEPITLVRIKIDRQGEKSEYINLCECTVDEVEKVFIDLIGAKTISPFVKGKKTSIYIRNYINGKNGSGKSLGFYGLSPKETMQLITNYLKNK